MLKILNNLTATLIFSLVLAIIMIVGLGMHSAGGFDLIFLHGVLRWLHVIFGILWVGLLYYFNFVQMRVMPEIPAEMKPAVTKYIAPEALFWFRYSALFTVIAGLGLAWARGYIAEALSFGFAGGFYPADLPLAFIGIGMWLALIMFFNVWHVIWPAQRIALGIHEAAPEAKAAAAVKAMRFSRINVLLSLPMLAVMAMYQTLFG
ncbi:hypothetical protein Q1W73_14470 [Asticcacaulis sp. ZE23SCel15]|uniref:hypothetical protein n=1 Tax=Asticcacaulis sp. ZE23SCel15 TaxID=3059027 RepID=UPI00265DA896|nr:hypothetical protein [Asticcacaulis sp. ZE23SCel15]WKL56857.1 hypothetical protein Q1W73_14470 [Asticcacaulis sp. ZE23SCel15]